MTINWIFDFETMGQSVIKAPIINCSFTVFDTSDFDGDGLSYEDVLDNIRTLKLDVKKQVDDGYIIKKDAVAFWQNMPKEVQAQIAPAKNDLTYSQFCDRLVEYLRDFTKIDYWWSRSNTFDPILLWRIFEDEGRSSELNEILKFWKVRDIRTFIDAKSDFSIRNDFIPLPAEEWKEKFHAHDSRHDVVADVLRMQKIYQLSRE